MENLKEVLWGGYLKACKGVALWVHSKKREKLTMVKWPLPNDKPKPKKVSHCNLYTTKRKKPTLVPTARYNCNAFLERNLWAPLLFFFSFPFFSALAEIKLENENVAIDIKFRILNDVTLICYHIYLNLLLREDYVRMFGSYFSSVLKCICFKMVYFVTLNLSILKYFCFEMYLTKQYF